MTYSDISQMKYTVTELCLEHFSSAVDKKKWFSILVHNIKSAIDKNIIKIP